MSRFPRRPHDSLLRRFAARALATVFASATVLCAAVSISHADRVQVPSSPIVSELRIGISAPHGALQAGVGAHGWISDFVMWGARVLGTRTPGATDRDGDGFVDFRETRPLSEAQIEFGLPLRWGMHIDKGWFVADGRTVVSATVRQISLVSGLRISLNEDKPIGLALGVRWSRRRIASAYSRHFYRERWIQARAIVFPRAQRIGRPGVDAEAMISVGAKASVGAYFEFLPTLSEFDNRGEYPVTVFNPLADSLALQLGVRLQVVLAGSP